MVNQTDIEWDLLDRLRVIRSHALALSLAYPLHRELCWRIYYFGVDRVLGHFPPEDY